MRVVNVRHEGCTHYIGRIGSYNASKHGVFCDLGNRTVLFKERERRTVVQAYEDWVRNDPGFVAQGHRARIKALPEDAVLGCWCKPLACHGDVIVKLWKELNSAANNPAGGRT